MFWLLIVVRSACCRRGGPAVRRPERLISVDHAPDPGHAQLRLLAQWVPIATAMSTRVVAD